ncbi:MAG: carboxypeptidase regulatory-like domain-containing protein [Pedobacter sp.]|nr:MAG: carboxypeptidase regulatory-like domain-containing protein [Pedobacter sp.]
MKIKLILRLLVLFSTFQIVYGQQNNSTIVAKYDSLHASMPKEKLYVHFDKSNYTTLDTIWFKAYLLDETLKNASTKSGLIHIEIIDIKGQLVKNLALPTGSGMTWGGIALNAISYPPGKYTFRAYTNWMQNFGEHYFFKKEIQIVGFDVSSYKVVASKNERNSSISSASSSPAYASNIDFQFLPEGGTWVINRLQNMAFKALNVNGKGIKIQGDIMDSKWQPVASFTSNEKGMGTFKMAPKTGETYTAVIKNGNTTKNAVLPAAIESGTSLQVINLFEADSIHVRVHSTLANQELLLIGQSRGLLCFATKIDANTNLSSLKIKKDVFPTGVTQIIIAKPNFQPLNERSIFINHQDQLKINNTESQITYPTRDSIPIHLKIADASGKPIVGSFSMAVTDDAQVDIDSNDKQNILSYLLLNSEIKGEIEEPGSYFNSFNEQRHQNLDILLLTQAWVSYRLQKPSPLLFNPELDFTISGLVTNLTNKPVANAKVSLIGNNKAIKNGTNGFTFLNAESNERGEFIFKKLPPLDSASFVIQALNAKEKRGSLGIKLNDFKRAPLPVPQKKTATVPTEASIDSATKNLISTQASIKPRGDGISLDAVEIKGKRAVKGSKNLNGPGEADRIIDEDELDKTPKLSLFQLLFEKISNLQIAPLPRSGITEFTIKGSPVKFFIDGIDIDFFYTPFSPNKDEHFRFLKSYLDYYKAEDVTGIEIMTSMRNFNNYDAHIASDTEVYRVPIRQTDTRAYVEITTKTNSGPFLKKSGNMFMYKPPTYGDLKVFYSPKYNSDNKSDPKPDFRSTLYWVPNLITDKNGEVKTSFFSSDRKGTFSVWIEGTDMEGNFGVKMMKLHVK